MDRNMWIHVRVERWKWSGLNRKLNNTLKYDGTQKCENISQVDIKEEAEDRKEECKFQLWDLGKSVDVKEETYDDDNYICIDRQNNVDLKNK